MIALKNVAQGQFVYIHISPLAISFLQINTRLYVQCSKCVKIKKEHIFNGNK